MSGPGPLITPVQQAALDLAARNQSPIDRLLGPGAARAPLAQVEGPALGAVDISGKSITAPGGPTQTAAAWVASLAAGTAAQIAQFSATFRWASGIWLGLTPPPNPVSIADYLSGVAGYWGWINPTDSFTFANTPIVNNFAVTGGTSGGTFSALVSGNGTVQQFTWYLCEGATDPGVSDFTTQRVATGTQIGYALSLTSQAFTSNALVARTSHFRLHVVDQGGSRVYSSDVTAAITVPILSQVFSGGLGSFVLQSGTPATDLTGGNLNVSNTQIYRAPAVVTARPFYIEVSFNIPPPPFTRPGFAFQISTGATVDTGSRYTFIFDGGPDNGATWTTGSSGISWSKDGGAFTTAFAKSGAASGALSGNHVFRVTFTPTGIVCTLDGAAFSAGLFNDFPAITDITYSSFSYLFLDALGVTVTPIHSVLVQ